MPGFRQAYSPVSIAYREGVHVAAGCMCVGEANAFARETIDVRRLQLRLAVGSDVAVAQIVGVDEHHVRAACAERALPDGTSRSGLGAGARRSGQESEC